MTTLLASLTVVVAQEYKVTERSVDKRPTWCDAQVHEAVVASGVGASLEDAMRACEGDIKRQVTAAVGGAIGGAIDTLSVHNIKSDELQSNGKSYGEIFADNFSSFIEGRADKVKYFKEISVKSASDNYWESRVGEDNKKSTLYMVKYPLPNSELKRLVANYKRFSDDNYKRLKELKSLSENPSKVGSVEAIDSAMMQASMLLSSFVDVQRHKEALAVQKSIYDMYGQIKVERVYSKIGCEELVLLLGDHSITYDKEPTIQGKSVSDIQYALNTSPFAKAIEDSNKSAEMSEHMQKGEGPKGGEGKTVQAKIVRAHVDSERVAELRKVIKDSYLLTYNYEKCHSGETSVIQLNYKFGTVNYKYLISFDIDRYKPSVQVLGNGHVKAGIREAGHASAIHITLPIRTYNCQKVFVETVTIHMPGVQYPLVINNVGETLVGSGESKITVYYPGRVEFDRGARGNINNQISGTISGQINDSLEYHEPFFLNVQSNWL